MTTPPETNLIDLFNHALCKTLLEDPSDVKKMIKQLDSIVKNVKNMKKSIQQMLVRNHPDAAATLVEDFEDSDAKFEKIEHAVKGVGERVKLVEEEVSLKVLFMKLFLTLDIMLTTLQMYRTE